MMCFGFMTSPRLIIIWIPATGTGEESALAGEREVVRALSLEQVFEWYRFEP
jgi:hypothetical protein